MNVLLIGATGFIGAALVDALAAAGHCVVLGVRDVVAAQRDWPTHRAVRVDFAKLTAAADWLPLLDGIDAVVNAAGVFQGSSEHLDLIHARAPIALFDACVQAGVERVVQISALGAEARASTDFWRSKNLADEHLLGLPLRSLVLQPSLVFGELGTSARMMMQVAMSPLWVLPDGGRQPVQPVHIDDVTRAVVNALAQPDVCGRVAAVGPHAMSFRDYLACLRRSFSASRARVLAIPSPIARKLAGIAQRLGAGTISPDALDMLAVGSQADPTRFTALLGRRPRDCTEFIGNRAARLRRDLRRPLWLGLLRCSLAVLWLVSGALSFGIYPVADSLSMLQRAAVPESLAPFALYGAAALDVAFGLLLLFAPRGRRAYRWQVATVLIYTVIIAVRLPELLLHPFAPIVKNLPVLAALWLLHREEAR